MGASPPSWAWISSGEWSGYRPSTRRGKRSRTAFTLTVVQRSNSRHPLELYRFLKEAGSRFMQFIPIVERASNQPDDAGLVLISPDSGSRPG